MRVDSVFFTTGLPSPRQTITKIGKQKNPEHQPLRTSIDQARRREEDFFIKCELPSTNELEVVGKESGQTYHIKLGGNHA
jgi:hypothetical protein